jgi:hypothetical protein
MLGFFSSQVVVCNRVIKIQSKNKSGKLLQDLLHVWDPEGNLSYLTDNTIKLLLPEAKDLDNA